MQKYKLLEEGKSCSLYRMKYNDGYYKYLVKDEEGDSLAMAVIESVCPPENMVRLVKEYDIKKVHAERRAEHKKWEKQFVEK